MLRFYIILTLDIITPALWWIVAPPIAKWWAFAYLYHGALIFTA